MLAMILHLHEGPPKRVCELCIRSCVLSTVTDKEYARWDLS